MTPADLLAYPVPLILMFGVFPLWVAAGFADWACHRATDIAATSGLRENLLHWLMFAEVGVGCLAVTFLEINAAVLLLVLAVFIVHEATVWVDLRWSVPRRHVRPVEQMVHSVQEMLPLVSLLLLCALGWEQALAILGLGPGGQVPDYALRLKSQPLPVPLVLAGGAAVVLFNALPLAQETWSCRQFRRRTRPTPAPR